MNAIGKSAVPSQKNRFSSPVDAYRARLLEVADIDREPGKSKLGLVRIAYEGNCTLTAELARGVLRVQAELTV